MDNIQSKKMPIVKSGIYVLKKNKKIVYIGESGNVNLRIGQHVKNEKMDFDEAECFEILESVREYVESILIKTYLPKYNIKNCYDDIFFLKSKTPQQRLLLSMGLSMEKTNISWIEEKVMINHVKTVISFILRRIHDG